MRLVRVCRHSISHFALGDLLIIIVFVILGEFSHGAMPWRVPVMVAETTMTFLVGWLGIAPLVWAYQRENLSEPLQAAGTGLIAWVGASAIANLLRSTPLVHGSGSLTFYLVAVVVGGAMISGWRYLRVRATVAGETPPESTP